MRVLLIVLGTFCVALGVLGIFLPVLPTTPFLLLAAICYARSSASFYHWLMTNRWCGEYIRNYREGRGMPLKHKVLTILLLWLTIGATSWFAISQWWLRLILVGIALAVTLHVVTIATYAPKTQPSPSATEHDAAEGPVAKSAGSAASPPQELVAPATAPPREPTSSGLSNKK